MKKNRLLLAILLLGVGFALVSTTLYLNGNVKIATNNTDFDVKFTKAILDGTDISSTAISEDGKTITFSTKDLSTVGDISKLDFEVTNNSEMYDANVSIDCTANGAKKSYYEITKEVASPIAGKRTEAGYVQVKLLKASVEDFSETFTCTLKATARERTTKAVQVPLPLGYTPKYFDFGYPSTSSTQDCTTLTYPADFDRPGAGQQAKVFIGLDEYDDRSVCIIRNDNLICFRGGGTTAYVSEEQAHIREVFSDGECTTNSYNDLSSVNCSASDFYCEVYSDGSVSCIDNTYAEYSHRCAIHSVGSIDCE